MKFLLLHLTLLLIDLHPALNAGPTMGTAHVAPPEMTTATNLYKCGLAGCDISSAEKTVECTSMFRCTLRCERNAGCTGVLYDAVNKICWLHSHTTSGTPTDANCCFKTC